MNTYHSQQSTVQKIEQECRRRQNEEAVFRIDFLRTKH